MTATGPVSGSLALTGSLGSSFTCSGMNATATETSYPDAVGTIEVRLVCSGP